MPDYSKFLTDPFGGAQQAIEAIQSSAGWDDMVQILDTSIKAFGFRSVLYVALPPFYQPETHTLVPCFFTTFGMDWIVEYQKLGLVKDDPLYKQCINGVPYPINWWRLTNGCHHPHIKLLKEELSVAKISASWGYEVGVTFPLNNVLTGRGVLSLVSDMTPTEFDVHLERIQEPVRLLVEAFHEVVMQREVARFTLPEFNILTKRETDVLQKLSHGFTYDQVADATGVGASTVRKHASSAIRKLKAKNTAHAAAIGMKWGVLW